jgi:ribonuclease H2 subunit A
VTRKKFNYYTSYQYLYILYPGPMVYGVCYCPVTVEPELRTLGAFDSKTLGEDKREAAFDKLCEKKDTVGWSVEIISPTTISNCMLKR